MKDDKFKIVVIAKAFSFDLNDILSRFPNKEKVLKDKLKMLTYEVIELVYEANYMPISKFDNIRLEKEIKVLSKISMIDFLLEESYRKGYITESIFINKVKELTNLSKKVKNWIANEKSNYTRTT